MENKIIKTEEFTNELVKAFDNVYGYAEYTSDVTEDTFGIYHRRTSFDVTPIFGEDGALEVYVNSIFEGETDFTSKSYFFNTKKDSPKKIAEVIKEDLENYRFYADETTRKVLGDINETLKTLDAKKVLHYTYDQGCEFGFRVNRKHYTIKVETIYGNTVAIYYGDRISVEVVSGKKGKSLVYQDINYYNISEGINNIINELIAA